LKKKLPIVTISLNNEIPKTPPAVNGARFYFTKRNIQGNFDSA
jgi:hypothetical protein